MKCKNCGSTNVDVDRTRGSVVCMDCGVVLEENTIITDVQFAENRQGASAPIGQFVSATGARSSYRVGTGGYSGLQKESREVTLSNGRRKIQQQAGQLGIKQQSLLDQAERLFMLAVHHNFIQGRKTENVVASCLYHVCRQNKHPLLLIDFADILQTNLYQLGTTFLKFEQTLKVRCAAIDPSFFILRFASKLEFGDKTQQVARTADKFVQRMKRDWMILGRRPAGICGAALLIAARVHGFRRTQGEIIDVVRVCDQTLRKRLNEFEQTPANKMTIDQFLDDKEEGGSGMLPPAFKKAEDARAKDDVEAAMEEVLQDEEAREIEGKLKQKEDLSALTPKERAKYQNNPRLADIKEVHLDPVSETLEDLEDDDALDHMILNEEEYEQKKRLWEEMNQDYEEAQREKERNEELGIKSKPAKKKKTVQGSSGGAAGAAEAGSTAKQAKHSSRINYSAVMAVLDKGKSAGVVNKTAPPAQLSIAKPTPTAPDSAAAAASSSKPAAAEAKAASANNDEEIVERAEDGSDDEAGVFQDDYEDHDDEDFDYGPEEGGGYDDEYY